MKKAFLGLMVAAACLAWLPAYAATYTYDVDYTFTVTTTNKTGSITGFITTNCDSCVLSASNILSWSFTANDGTSESSTGPKAGISASGDMLVATPMGISTDLNATLDASIRFCNDITNGGADCFPTAGLDIYNNDVGDQPFPFWHLYWDEISSAEGIFSTNGGGLSPAPAIQIASLAIPEPPVWAMMIIGFAGLGFAAHRRERRAAKLRIA
jgi:PEP-CTERM motif-containing protein